ncbi:hypothetical protein RCO48_02145 [Peribacillus frigoritolerans]|nr:hypothetical protein [Peribacillus frigoritolerans]
MSIKQKYQICVEICKVIFETKKAKPQDSAEPELQEEAEHKEEKNRTGQTRIWCL